MKNNQLKAAIYLRFNRIADFAQKVGEDPTLVSRVLSGQMPGEERRKRYANVLGVKECEIFSGEVVNAR